MDKGNADEVKSDFTNVLNLGPEDLGPLFVQ